MPLTQPSQSGFRWPDDYVRLDNGRLLVRPDCVDGFRALGWTTLTDVMNASNVETVRQLSSRDNCRVRIPCGDRTVDGYLKRHRVRRLRRWFLERRMGRAGKTPGMSEANAVGWCAAAGVPTVSVIAAGEQPGCKRRHHSDSLFMSESLIGHVPANEFWFPHEMRLDPPSPQSDPGLRRRVLQAVAATARRFHSAGLFHFDFYLDHFFVNPADPRTAYLLDLQRVEKRTLWARRFPALIKDLGQFQTSCRRYRLDEAERGVFEEGYVGGETPAVIHKLSFRTAAARRRIRRLRRTVLPRGERVQDSGRAA